MTVRFVIVATEIATGERFECFHWTRDAASGVERAKRDAVRFGMAAKLADYRAEPVEG
jgi:hypothetical protein